MGFEAGISVEVISSPREDGFVVYNIEVMNSRCASCLEFYGYEDVFSKFAEELQGFPKHIDHNVRWEIGSADLNHLTHMILDVFCYDPNGHSAIQMYIREHSSSPYFYKTEFFLRCEPSEINRLGQVLGSWDPVKEKVFEWKVRQDNL